MGSRKAITKEQIIDVAYETAQREGLSSLSVRAVAEACGVATGTMYNHIPDIAELRTEVLRRFWREALIGADLDQCAREAGSALDYCRKLTETLAESLRGFRSTWLRDAGAADGRTRQRAAEAERACLQDIQLTVRHAFERDTAISERARAELDMGKVAEFVWTAMLMGIKCDDSSCETLFALVELALY